MKTEDEARELRCCGPDGCGGWAHENDAPDIPDGGYVRYCIASDCMAWEPEPILHYADKPSGKGDCGLKRSVP